MWKYTAENDYPNIILHDCKVVRVEKQDKDIIFKFDERGFWISESNSQNPYSKILRTDEAEMRFLNCDMDFMEIYVFKEIRLFGKFLMTKRIKIPFEEFASKINSG